MEPRKKQPVTTGGAGYVPQIHSSDFIDNIIFNLSKHLMYIAAYGMPSPSTGYTEPFESMAQASYLTPRNIQKERFIRAGYTENPKDYGLVKKAVGNRNIPVYQKKPDDEKRENVIPIGNLSNRWYGQLNARLIHPGHFPSTIYINPENSKLYQKAWDLNDYGGGTGAYNRYPEIGKLIANIADKIGSPTVVTSGISRINEEDIDDNFRDAILDPFMKSKGLTRYEDYIEEKYPQYGIDGNPIYNLDGSRLYYVHKNPFTFYGLPEVIIKPRKK